MTVTHPIGLSAPTLADPVIAEAAARFVASRRSAAGLADFPGPLPADLATAYAIQATATASWPDEVAGWKVARVPPALEETLGAMRYIGPIFARTVSAADGGPLSFPVIPGGFGAVEAEFAVRIAADAPADKLDYSPAEAAAFIAAVHAAIEVAGGPLAPVNALGPTASTSVFGNNNGLIVGEEIVGGVEGADALRAEVLIDGQSVGVGSAAKLPGGIAAAVAVALGMAARLGRPLKAGQWVSTGALTGVHAIAFGQQARVTFTGLAPMSGTAVAAGAIA
ncbi:2-keto-4-pentenoate hydratase [Azospirillum sp. TSH7]|uniref:2-keto-4-pentenoate hydratase n=1 Tax=unclassified Azospirillum TaxID=2630922 RepID=UPI000D6082D2|nr:MULTISPECIES: 2-keto-4-pentenoate hydratase [unclassified Azospirillum]PWC53886.1 2-keto-4-pentenoate hydratase [Azospirillum sp. TSH7]PWC68863.1 2-keto-4-pentenoate hydratase [Azospirillum sp. TSH20]